MKTPETIRIHLPRHSHVLHNVAAVVVGPIRPNHTYPVQAIWEGKILDIYLSKSDMRPVGRLSAFEKEDISILNQNNSPVRLVT